MPDKPPPIYVVFSSGGHADGIAQLTTSESRSVRYVVMEHARGCDDARAEKYEPAVPRCKTCGLFEAPCSRDSQAWCNHLPRAKKVPRDGSGYCHNHPDAKP